MRRIILLGLVFLASCGMVNSLKAKIGGNGNGIVAVHYVYHNSSGGQQGGGGINEGASATITAQDMGLCADGCKGDSATIAITGKNSPVETFSINGTGFYIEPIGSKCSLGMCPLSPNETMSYRVSCMPTCSSASSITITVQTPPSAK